MSAELQKTIDEIGKTISEFKALNDRRYEEQKKLGTDTAESRAATDKANAAITALEVKLADEQKKLRELETLTARLSLSPKDEKDKTREHAGQFFAMMAARRGEPEQVVEKAHQVSAEQVNQYKDYKKALNQYIRWGKAALGRPEIQAALTVGTDPAGGFTVTPDTSGRVAELVFESSPMRQYAFIQNTGKDRVTGYNDLDEDTTGSGWVGEVGDRPETSTPELGKWEIPVHEQYANPRASQTVLEDSEFDIENWLTRKVAGRLSRREATAFVGGDGVGKPRGFTTYTSASAPTKANWQRVERTGTGSSGAFAAAPAGGDVFITCMGLMKEAYLPGAIWAMNRTTKAAARKLKDSNGHYILLQDFRDGFRESCLGLLIAPFEDMPAIGANSDSIALANFTEGYTIVDRRGLTLLRDPYTAKPYVQLYTTRRVGGDVTNFEAIKLIRFA